MEYRYKELSHIECYESSVMLPNEEPEVIPQGKRYDDLWCTVEPTVANEDEARWRLFDTSFANHYKAKKSRYKFGYTIGNASYIEAKNDGIIQGHYGKWYWKAYIIIHFLDGTTTTKYFNTDAEMETYINMNFSGLNKRMRS